MREYLYCPHARCFHRIPVGGAAAEEMTDHLIDRHQFPVISASYQAGILRPIPVATAA